MPRPITGDGSEPEPGAGRAHERLETPERERDSRGHDLAMHLPDWDLVPPTEFLDRTRGR